MPAPEQANIFTNRQLPLEEVGLQVWKKPHGQINLTVLHFLPQMQGVVAHGVDRNGWRNASDSVHHARQEVDFTDVGHRNRELPCAGRRLERGPDIECASNLRQRLGDGTGQLHGIGRRRHAVGCTDEQFVVQETAEPIERVADAGLRHSEVFGRAPHQWTYDLKGNLQGVPFRRGLKKDGEVRGGMPADFKPTDHPLNKLKVTVRNGVIFASFDHDIEPLESYFGPEILPSFDRVFDGRKLTVLGYSRQRVPSNWKLMQENLKDPYHVGLLHTWFVVFGLIRGDQKSRLVTDVHGRHGAMASTREKVESGEVTKGLSSFKEGMILHDNRIVDVKPESWWNGPTVVMLTLFPNLIVQQQSNSMSTRQIIPRGPGSFDFVWTHFGFEEDDPDMALRRLRQANMFGPAGYVSADDGEVLEFCQQSYEQEPTRSTLAEQGGRDWGEVNHLITENPIRAMFAYWRKVMEI